MISRPFTREQERRIAEIFSALLIEIEASKARVRACDLDTALQCAVDRVLGGGASDV